MFKSISFLGVSSPFFLDFMTLHMTLSKFPIFEVYIQTITYLHNVHNVHVPNQFYAILKKTYLLKPTKFFPSQHITHINTALFFTYFGMNTAYRIANVLSWSDYNWESQKDDTCNAPVEAEYCRAVSVNQSINMQQQCRQV